MDRAVSPGAHLLALILAASLSLVIPGNSWGCFGARPLSMGGAFVAAADDAHSTYWNPAGLTHVETPQITATGDTDWGDLNYDVFTGAATPIGSRVGAGLLYVFNEDGLADGQYANEHLLQGALGVKLLPDRGGILGAVSVGAAGKWLHGSRPDGSADSEDLDLSFLVDLGPRVSRGIYPGRRMFSVGCLFQDVLQSDYTFPNGPRQHFALNVRPAAAFRPDGLTTIAAEVYDAASQGSLGTAVRIGGERWIPLRSGRTWVALRAGGYHLNQESMRAATFGLGVRPWSKAEVAYGLLYWTQSGQTTHLISASLWL